MKLFKRLFSYLIALTMVLSLAAFTGVKVNAEDPTYKLTLKGTTTGHIYEAYQIFKGDLVEKDGKKILSNVKWGTGVTYTQGKDENKSPADVAKDLGDNKMTIDTLISRLTLTTPAATVDSAKGNTVIDGLTAGYYLVKDKDGTQDGTSDAYTKFIVQVVGDAESNIKSDVPSVEKKVKDINDSEEASETNPTNWQDSADYDIGDSIPYKLTATLGTKYGDYKTYKLEFVDNLTSGLDYDTNVAYKVTVGTEDGADITDKFIKSESEDHKTITWTCNDLKDVPAKDKNGKDVTIKAGSKIIVTYNAKLNDSAVIGAKGNPNTVYLKYSNNPNYTGEGKDSPEGQTPKDKNIVFTYAAKFNKVDGSNGNKPLAGAKFTLYKFTTEKKDKDDVASSYDNTTGFWHSLGEKEATIQADKKYTAYYKGLDDGVYKLVETHTPDGYNTMADKIFTVIATHNDGDEPSFGTLTVNDLTTTISNGTFTSDIENKSGSILPSTGGMGTTLLYVAGGILVACAAAYVVLNKKRA